MDKLQWIFELIDRVSGPANSATASIDRVERSMKRASGTSEGFVGRLTSVGASFSRITFAVLPTVIALGQIATAGIAVGNVMRMMGVNSATLRAGFDAIRGGAARAVASLKAFGMRAWEALKKIPPSAYAAAAAIVGIGLAARTAKRAVQALVSPFSQLASMTISAAPFLAIGGALATVTGQLDMIVSRQRLVRGFDIMLGAGQGERVMQRIVGLSEMMGTPIQETANAARELFSKGFNEARVFELIQGFSDLRAVNPSADLGRIALAMGQVRQAGRLQGDELNQLAEGGLNLSRVMPRIAGMLGIDPTKVRDAMREGRITADIFERAVLGAMEDQAGGTIGSIAEEMSHSLGGEWDRLTQAPERFFERVAAGGSDSTDRLTRSLGRINELLDPDSAQGQRVVEMLALGVEKLADAMDWLTTNGDSISSTFRGLGIILTPLWWTLTGLAQIAIWVADAWQGWSMVGSSLVDKLVAFDRQLVIFEAMARAKFTFITESMYAFGRNVVQGLVNGITSMALAPANAMMGMGDSMLTSLRNALGIRSPSREMAYLGEMVGAGFMVGLGNSGMQTSLDGRMEAPPLGSTAQASALMGATINVTIQVDATGNPDAPNIAQQIEALLIPRLSAAFESLALESGV
jgi:tape measure domain-containing protein